LTAWLSARSLDSTYYVVDPGDTKEDCDPPLTFQPNVIIVTSPDSTNWGGSEFTAARGSVQGVYKFYPIWTLDELLDARPIIQPNVNEHKVLWRFRQFGGIPRHMFHDSEILHRRKQIEAIANLSVDAVRKIGLGSIDCMSTFDSTQPESDNGV
jgi:hypothetical protein